MTEWISVEDRLPKNGSGDVIWYHPPTTSNHGMREYIRISSCNIASRPATHWMPLPEPPE